MEKQIILKAQSGDQDAFYKIMIEYGTLIKKIVRTLVKDKEKMEDVLQEAWMDVWLGLSKFDIDRDFRPWLITIVANRCRKSFRMKNSTFLTYNDEIVDDSVLLDDPETIIIQTLDEIELRKVLITLPEEQQQLLALRFYVDLKLEEIAQTLDLPLSTVKSKLYRILKFLREELQTESSSLSKSKGK